MHKQIAKGFYSRELLFLEGDLYGIFQMKMMKEILHKGMGGYGGPKLES